MKPHNVLFLEARIGFLNGLCRLLSCFLLSTAAGAEVTQENWYQSLLRQNETPDNQPHPNPWVESARNSWPDFYIYRLTYVDETAAPERYIRNILRAIGLQQEQIGNSLAAIPGYPVDVDRKPGENEWKVRAALSGFRTLHSQICPHCRNGADRARNQELVNAFMNAYDLREAGGGSLKDFSGLPFFNLVRDRILDPVFRTQVIELASRLKQILSSFAENPHHKLHTNLLETSLNVTKGDRERAIEMLGILLARDSQITQYFRLVASRDRRFMEAMGNVPLLVRLVSELDKRARNSKVDYFSYDGIFHTKNVKNYFFWASALVAQKLRLKGFSSEEIQRLNLKFTRFYKRLRYVSNWGFHFPAKNRPDNYRAFWLKDAKEIIWMSGRGGQLSLTPRTKGAMYCSDLF